MTEAERNALFLVRNLLGKHNILLCCGNVNCTVSPHFRAQCEKTRRLLVARTGGKVDGNEPSVCVCVFVC
jgi:hypothetical protein